MNYNCRYTPGTPESNKEQTETFHSWKGELLTKQGIYGYTD